MVFRLLPFLSFVLVPAGIVSDIKLFLVAGKHYRYLKSFSSYKCVDEKKAMQIIPAHVKTKDSEVLFISNCQMRNGIDS